MEWTTSIRKTIQFMEENLTNDISVQDVADQAYVSAMLLQKGFSVMTGLTIGEYLRNRRLTEAANDLLNTNERVIDIAYKYCYETPESFTKAFQRFHNGSPSEIRSKKIKARRFLPLAVNVSLTGGSNMKYKIAKMFPFKVIGFEKVFSSETAYQEIPKFWDEICEKYAANVYMGNEPANPYEKAIMDYCIGEYGVCIDDIGEDKFRYLIAGRYLGGEVPEGMTVYEFSARDWAVFDCVGPIPESLQNLNTEIFSQFLPGNPEYELEGNATIEWYDCINGEKTDADYHSAIWIPVKKK